MGQDLGHTPLCGFERATDLTFNFSTIERNLTYAIVRTGGYFFNIFFSVSNKLKHLPFSLGFIIQMNFNT